MDLNQLHADMMNAVETFRAAHKKADDELKSLGHVTSETTETVNRMNARIDEMETQLNRPRLSARDGQEVEATPQQRAFAKFMRRGANALSLEEFNAAWPEAQRAMSTDDDVNGGYLVPRNVRNTIIELLVEFSPMRQLAQVDTISIGNSLLAPKEGTTDFEAGWVGEREARPETGTADLGGVAIPTHEQYANPRATQTMLDDTEFGIESWMNRRVSRRFALLEGAAFISGDGVNKPRGILTGLNANYIVPTGHATQITADGWMKFVYNLPEFYAGRATILTRRATVLETRLLKTGDGNYIWQPGLSAGSPSTILGYPYREAPDMPAIAANAIVAAFGDWKMAYNIVDRQGIRVLRDPFTAKPWVQFYHTRRVGGQVVLDEAYRVMKVAAA